MGTFTKDTASESWWPTCKFTYWFMAATPWLQTLLFWLFVCQARIILGRWPVPYDPDPKDIGGPLYWLLFLSRILWGYSILMMPVLAFILARPLRHLHVRWWLGALLFIVGSAVVIIVSRWDPGDFHVWVMD